MPKYSQAGARKTEKQITPWTPSSEAFAKINKLYYLVRGPFFAEAFDTLPIASPSFAEVLATEFTHRLHAQGKSPADAVRMEVGIGNGSLSSNSLPHLQGARYMLVDFSDDLLANARRRPVIAEAAEAGQASFHRMDATVMDFPKESVDSLVEYELWSDLPHTEFLVRSRAGVFRMESCFGVDEKVFSRRFPGASLDEFANAFYSGSADDFRKHGSNALSVVRLSHRQAPLNWGSLSYPLLEEAGVNVKGIVTEVLNAAPENTILPFHFGAAMNLIRAMDVLQNGGVMDVFDYGGETNFFDEKMPIRTFGGQPTTDVNFTFMAAVASAIGRKHAIQPLTEFVRKASKLAGKTLIPEEGLMHVPAYPLTDERLGEIGRRAQTLLNGGCAPERLMEELVSDEPELTSAIPSSHRAWIRDRYPEWADDLLYYARPDLTDLRERLGEFKGGEFTAYLKEVWPRLTFRADRMIIPLRREHDVFVDLDSLRGGESARQLLPQDFVDHLEKNYNPRTGFYHMRVEK